MNHNEKRDKLADEYAESCDNESGSFLSHQLENIRKKAYRNGWDARDKDLLERGVEFDEVKALRTYYGSSAEDNTDEQLLEIPKRSFAVENILEAMKENHAELTKIYEVKLEAKDAVISKLKEKQSLTMNKER